MQSHLIIKSHNLAQFLSIPPNSEQCMAKMPRLELSNCAQVMNDIVVIAKRNENSCCYLPFFCHWAVMWITSEMKASVINVTQIHHFQAHSCHMPVSHGFNLNERKTVSFPCLNALIAIVRCKVRPGPERKRHRSDDVCIPLLVWTRRHTDYNHAKSAFVSVMLLLFGRDSFNSINCRC